MMSFGVGYPSDFKADRFGYQILFSMRRNKRISGISQMVGFLILCSIVLRVL
jgi:hypothetical protein